MKYVSIDTETTGLDKKNCRLLEAAFVVEDSARVPLPPVEELPFFVALVQPPLNVACWEVGAAGLHKQNGLLEDLKRAETIGHGIDLSCVASWDDNPALPAKGGTRIAYRYIDEGFLHDVVDFLRNRGAFGSSHRAVVAGKNFGGFDAHFLPPELLAMFHHRVIDPGSVLIDWSKETPASLGEIVPPVSAAPAAHRALADARDVIRALRTSYKRG